MLNQIINQAVAEGADHIHLVVNAKPMIRYKTKIRSFDMEPLTALDLKSFVEMYTPDDSMELLEKKGEVNYAYAITDVGRFRINVLKQRGTYSVSIRVHKLELPQANSLSIPDKTYEIIKQKSGLFLVAGPSGSGKSTTLATLAKFILSQESVQLITVESPIEYLLKHDKGIILQREVGIDCSDIYTGLLSASLHDPDVLIISEISDDATMDLALKIAESGKLVIAGYTARNSIASLERMMLTDPIRMALRQYQLASNLTGILAQQLIETCGVGEIVMVPELLIVNDAIRTHIRGNQLSEIQNSLISGRKQGMISMDMSLFTLYTQGFLDYDKLMQYSIDHDYTRRLLEEYRKTHE